MLKRKGQKIEKGKKNEEENKIKLCDKNIS